MSMKSIFYVLVFTVVILLAFSLGTASANNLTPMEKLGKNLFFDNISDPDWMSCATCHAPETGWTGPVAGINQHGAVYRGAVPTRFGNRKPPSAAYATLSPVFHYDSDEGLFIGGNFWDGRATGEDLGNPAADQARGPFLNPLEQNNPSKESVCKQVAREKYAYLFMEAFGEAIMCNIQKNIDINYDRIALAIAAYEDSSEVNQFSSKFDAYKAGIVDLSAMEKTGMELFKGDAQCVLCHVMDGQGPNGEDLFTDFSFDNLGVPRNPENPFYEQLDFNPLGSDWVDEGLGGFLRTRPEWADMADNNIGKHKVPTLRNVAKGFGKGFPKAYMHNGVFKSLKEVVHFYNTRDVEDWPAPEIPQNVNTDELGDLGLTNAEEDAIVAFMNTLSDGFKVKKKVK